MRSVVQLYPGPHEGWGEDTDRDVSFPEIHAILPLKEFTSKGAIAQLGERLPCTQEVTGSSPVSSTSEVTPRF